VSDGDAIDISDVLVGFDPLTSAITDFVSISTSGSDSRFMVDADGTVGGSAYTDIALIVGVTGLDVQTLYNSGDIIA